LERVHPEDRTRMRAIAEAAIRTDEPLGYEARLVRPAHEVRLMHSRRAVLWDASGRPERVVGTAQDITERKQAAEERAMANRANTDSPDPGERTVRPLTGLRCRKGLGGLRRITPEQWRLSDRTVTGLSALARLP
jgi:hypothetical protein